MLTPEWAAAGEGDSAALCSIRLAAQYLGPPVALRGQHGGGAGYYNGESVENPHGCLELGDYLRN